MVERGLILEAWCDHLFSEEIFVDTTVAYCSTWSLKKNALWEFCSGGLWNEVWTMAGMATNWWGLKFSSWTLEEFQALGKLTEDENNALEY